ncbi:MAG: hypothetical protein WC715_00465 [Patescibacteria group bacterium]|jgi:hypothetical protein
MKEWEFTDLFLVKIFDGFCCLLCFSGSYSFVMKDGTRTKAVSKADEHLINYCECDNCTTHFADPRRFTRPFVPQMPDKIHPDRAELS